MAIGGALDGNAATITHCPAGFFENPMKRCPTCLRTYSEESLRFCRVDGAVLSAVESQDTLIKLPTLERRTPDTQSLQAEGASPKLSQITFDEAIEEYAAWLRPAETKYCSAANAPA